MEVIKGDKTAILASELLDGNIPELAKVYTKKSLEEIDADIDAEAARLSHEKSNKNK